MKLFVNKEAKEPNMSRSYIEKCRKIDQEDDSLKFIRKSMSRDKNRNTIEEYFDKVLDQNSFLREMLHDKFEGNQNRSYLNMPLYKNDSNNMKQFSPKIHKRQHSDLTVKRNKYIKSSIKKDREIELEEENHQLWRSIQDLKKSSNSNSNHKVVSRIKSSPKNNLGSITINLNGISEKIDKFDHNITFEKSSNGKLLETKILNTEKKNESRKIFNSNKYDNFEKGTQTPYTYNLELIDKMEYEMTKLRKENTSLKNNISKLIDERHSEERFLRKIAISSNSEIDSIKGEIFEILKLKRTTDDFYER